MSFKSFTEHNMPIQKDSLPKKKLTGNAGADSPILRHDPKWTIDYAKIYCKLPDKERLIVQNLRDFIDSDEDNTVALVAGIRQIGKTVALKQLWASYPNAVYIDLSAEGIDSVTIEDEFLDKPTGLLLLDEVVSLDDYEQVLQRIFNASRTHGFKVVMTGSSPAHITKLSVSKLGGRSCLFRLPPIMFIEYLYLTGRISDYNDYSCVTNEDFADYLLMKNLKDLRIQFDTRYFDTFYREIEIGNEKRYMSHSLVDLKENDLLHMCDLVAYKLNEAASYNKSIGHKLNIGGREYNSLNALKDVTTTKWGKIDLSDAFLTESKTAVQRITVQDKARILHFLLWSGMASVEFEQKSDADTVPKTGDVLSILKNCKKPSELIELFDEVSICLTSPLFYTRLGVDIVSKMGVDVRNLCRGDMLGKMLEVYVRGSITKYSVKPIMSSIKLRFEADGLGEVDIYEGKRELLLETTCSDKDNSDIHVGEYLRDVPLIRVCSTDTKDNSKDISAHGFYKIPYAKLCCMIDTGAVFDLEKT